MGRDAPECGVAARDAGAPAVRQVQDGSHIRYCHCSTSSTWASTGVTSANLRRYCARFSSTWRSSPQATMLAACTGGAIALPLAAQQPAASSGDEATNLDTVSVTGTRIRVREGQRRCTAFAGRVWTRDDLDRTGQTDIGDALRMLDVSIR